ncbi:MAG: hypothetical protein NTZ05_11910, partial [Chloroflexi bacterium]|nr:hypothetical protein [Chloroflexota bacterium]
RQGWNEGSTVKGRKLWYDLGLLPKGQRAQMFWSMSHQYRHIAPLNVDGIICNHNLFDLWAGKDVEYRVLWAILNSTAVALSKIQFGRPVGREGILKTEVVDVKMMLVPDPRRATPEIAARLQDAMDRISARPIRPIIEEFPLADRQALDDAVLELLGISLPEERTAIRTQLYGELTAFYQGTRRLEIQAMGNRMRTARQGRVTPTSLAEELWAEVDINKLRVFPDGFLNGNEECDVIDLPPGKLEVGRQMFALGAGLAAGTVAVDGIRIDAGTLPRAEFLSALNEYGLSGNVSVPLSDQVCTDALKEFREFQMEQRQRFTDLAATRTGNPQTQRAVIRALERRSQYWRPG